MAAQSGVLFFDGRPTENEREALAAGLAPIAPDGVQTMAQAGMAMAFGACHVWTGEERCLQPLQTDAGLAMTWDGRLDNRDDLQLRLCGRLDASAADASIAVAVFERWGTEGLRSLIGDWSLAIWDGRTRTLHLARDYMGVRPLYYHVGGGAVMWSTSLGELAIRSGRVDDLNEEFVARFMTLQFSTEVTPYVGIRAVPTATCVSFSPDGVESRRRFWSLEPGHIRYRDSRQYEEHLRALWVDAVGSRLRTNGTVWAELSGGLDSSSVVCMADALLKAGRVPARDLRTVSHVTLESSEGDERTFVREVDRWTGRETDILGVELCDEENEPDWDWVTPLAPRGVRARSIRHVRDRSGQVVLTGRVGDAAMGCIADNFIAVFDDLQTWAIWKALGSMRQWSRASRKPFLEVAWSLARVGSSFAERRQPEVSVLAEGMRSHMIETDRSADSPRGIPPARRALAKPILAYMAQARLETWAGAGGVLETHAFTHRPLVEYVLAIPAEELSAPGTPRALMRRAFAGVVPERILRRESKGHYAPAALRLAQARLRALPPAEELECVLRGWVDPGRWRAATAALFHESDIGAGVQQVLRIEHWLASRHRRGPAVIPRRKEVRTNDVRIA